jgi:dolichyl-phosphate-mannose-protein mannosyltransferase
MKDFFKRNFSFWDLIFLTSLSFFTRFFSLFRPSKVVFDEAHFGLYAAKYLSHQYFFDIHPPLGKLLLASASFFGKVKPGFAFEINSWYPAFNFLTLRLLPAFFGVLLVALIYLFVKEMGFSRRVAFVSGFLALFDNALLVQSRFILLDIILVFFIFLALYLFLLTKKHSPFSSQWYLLNFLCGLVLGGAISIKWTGFGILGIIWFLTIFNQRLFSRSKKEILIKAILIFLLPLLFYFLIFALHFYLLPLPCQSDCGAALTWPLYPETNYFFNHPPVGNILNKLKEVHIVMLADALTNSSFGYQSDWWSWPFLIRPVKYFQDIQGEKISAIYLLGNPIVWWLSALGVLGYIYLITKNYFLRLKLNLPHSFYSESCFILFLGYLVYTISFSAVKRFLVIYHYLPALVFAIIIFAIFLKEY